jgi:uncharacterized protein
MKRLILLSVLLVGFYTLRAQTKTYKVVFDITSQDTSRHQAALRHANGMATSYPGSEVEVVVYGGAINMVLKDKSVAVKTIEDITANNKNIKIKVCAVTMKRYNIDKSMLIPGVEIVPDAIVEIITKQGEGWGYIKEAN